MPIRKQTGRVRRISDQDIETLGEMVAAGVPWNYVRQYDGHKGRGDLILLVRGFYYVTDFVTAADDIETMGELWWTLREAIIEQHIKFQPFSRPWGFYSLEDRPPRRRLNKEPCRCLEFPEHSQKFPPSSMSWFGRPRHCQCDYENDGEYLEPNGLLVPGENEEVLSS